MDKTTEFRAFRFSMMKKMREDGKTAAEIRKAVMECDERYRKAKEKEKAK